MIFLKSHILKLIADVLMTTAGKESNLVTDSRKMKNTNSLVLYVSLCPSLPIQSFSHIKLKINNFIKSCSHTELHPSVLFNTDNPVQPKSRTVCHRATHINEINLYNVICISLVEHCRHLSIKLSRV